MKDAATHEDQQAVTPAPAPAPAWRRWLIAPLTVAALVGSMFAIAQPVPLDSVVRVLQARALPLPPSGQIVIVNADYSADPTIRTLADDRRRDAALLEAIRRLKPARVLIEKRYFEPSSPEVDRALARTLSSFDRPVILAAKTRKNPGTDVSLSLTPTPILTAAGQLGATSYGFGYLGISNSAFYSRWIGGQLVPSFASIIAGQSNVNTGEFLLESRINPRAVPHVDSAVILAGAAPAGQISGKTVLIAGPDKVGEIPWLPDLGDASQAEFHALAGETLLRGRPVDLGGWALLAAMLAVEAAGLAWGWRPRHPNLWRAGGLLTAVALATVARLWMVNLTVAPMAAAMVAVAVQTTWRRKKQRAHFVNLRSGLPNMDAIRAVDPGPNAAIVVARLMRHEEIMTTLSGDDYGVFALEVARRLRSGNDLLTIYHDGSGHFAWHQPAATLDKVDDHVRGLRSFFAEPVKVGDRLVDAQPCFGIDLNEGRSPGLRFSSASDAATQAATSGEVARRVRPERLGEAEWRTSIHSEVERALRSNEIWVSYQPKLDLRRGRITGAEALVRWNHPTRGNVPPNDFIALMEEDGRIDQLTWAVLDHALSSSALITAEAEPFGVAVNLSAVMLERPDLHPTVMAQLDRHQVPAERLTLELTETVPLTHNAVTMDNLLRLRASGVRVSIDDYGTGASTLLYLRHVPCDEVKIDRAFVVDLPTNPVNAAIVRGTVDMVHALGRTVVAEGVEDMATLTLLGHYGCDAAQGFYVAKPQPIADVREMVLNQREVRLTAIVGN